MCFWERNKKLLAFFNVVKIYYFIFVAQQVLIFSTLCTLPSLWTSIHSITPALLVELTVTIKDERGIRERQLANSRALGLCHSNSWGRTVQYSSVPQPSYSLLTFLSNLQSYSMFWVLFWFAFFFSPADYFSPNQPYNKSSRSYSSAASLAEIWIRSAAMLIYTFQIVFHTFFSV